MPAKIEKRGEGTYLLTVADGYDEHGKQIFRRKRIHATSEREAQKEYIAFAAEVHQHQTVATSKCKLTQFARQWFADYCKKELAPKTQRSYQNHLEKRILPALGHIDIGKLTPQHVIKFLNDLRQERRRFDGRDGTLSDESLRYCFRVLSSMLCDAVEWQVIANNPCDRVKPPSVSRKKVKIMEEGSLAKMFVAMETEPIKYRTLLTLAIDSGLRLGELVGLKWADIEFEKHVLHVTKSNQAMKGRGIYTKSPKNETSVRDVTLSESTTKLLEEYKVWQTEQKLLLSNKWHDEDWLFTQWNGLPVFPTSPSAWFRKFLKRNNLPPMPFHALRHLSATVLIAQGVPLKNVSSRLGHADIRTTANIYSEALQSIDRQAADKMDEFLRKSTNKRDNQA